MMDEVKRGQAAAPVRRVIACTPNNAADMAALVRRWPDLHALVHQLRADGLFPGLRGLQIGLTGAPDWVAMGLAAPLPDLPATGRVEA